jgi:hypothetical protein
VHPGRLQPEASGQRGRIHLPPAGLAAADRPALRVPARSQFGLSRWPQYDRNY